jgi:hypothetical protein
MPDAFRARFFTASKAFIGRFEALLRLPFSDPASRCSLRQLQIASSAVRLLHEADRSRCLWQALSSSDLYRRLLKSVDEFLARICAVLPISHAQEDQWRSEDARNYMQQELKTLNLLSTGAMVSSGCERKALQQHTIALSNEEKKGTDLEGSLRKRKIAQKSYLARQKSLKMQRFSPGSSNLLTMSPQTGTSRKSPSTSFDGGFLTPGAGARSEDRPGRSSSRSMSNLDNVHPDTGAMSEFFFHVECALFDLSAVTFQFISSARSESIPLPVGTSKISYDELLVEGTNVTFKTAPGAFPTATPHVDAAGERVYDLMDGVIARVMPGHQVLEITVAELSRVKIDVASVVATRALFCEWDSVRNLQHECDQRFHYLSNREGIHMQLAGSQPGGQGGRGERSSVKGNPFYSMYTSAEGSGSMGPLGDLSTQLADHGGCTAAHLMRLLCFLTEGRTFERLSCFPRAGLGLDMHVMAEHVTLHLVHTLIRFIFGTRHGDVVDQLLVSEQVARAEVPEMDRERIKSVWAEFHKDTEVYAPTSGASPSTAGKAGGTGSGDLSGMLPSPPRPPSGRSKDATTAQVPFPYTPEWKAFCDEVYGKIHEILRKFGVFDTAPKPTLEKQRLRAVLHYIQTPEELL